ncbi:MAG: penicillin-binding protein [Lachnospiraceae bacterium]|nr:penicillin-binding protein [Lachnospiraceae bacterium]
MFSELWEFFISIIKSIVKSRLFVVSILFIGMFSVLVMRLFRLQIVEGAGYQENYVQKTLNVVSTSGTRGNIYDRNGNLLAYSKLAYAVSIGDTGYYKNGYERNEMLLRLIPILEKHGETLVTSLSLALDGNGNIQYTTSSEEERLRFLRDVYGLKSVEDLDDEDGKYPSDVSAAQLFQYLKERYGVGENADKTTYEVDDETALKMLNIRYAMTLNAFRRYDAITVASDIKLETVADIKENSEELKEVNVEEQTVRIYNDSYAFSHILGYTGQADADELEELQKQDESYELGDVIGKSGIESAMELELSGVKGKQTMYLDSEGRILEITDTTEPETGNDIYLSIDRDLQVGIYHLIEQNLAGILVQRLTDDPTYVVTEDTDASKILIPVKNAYFQFINNNILSMEHFSDETASSLEKSIYDRYISRKASVLPDISSHLMNEASPAFDKCSADMQDYQDYIFDYMRDHEFFLEGSFSSSDSIYMGWVNETISFHDFLYHAVEEGWIDPEKLNSEAKYTSTDDTFRTLIDTLTTTMDTDTGFQKLIYKYLIQDNVVSGRELCLCLFEQGVLERDEAAIASLSAGNDDTAYQFLKDKISNMELTPAQLALDPCSASCVITDVNTGEVKALVTYPGYDINRFSGSIDSAYYWSLYNDLSQPFLNRATQVETAPGSIFKVLTSVIGLEEHVVNRNTIIDDTGTFERQGLHLRCWNTSGHGNLDVVGALAQSCNYYFSEIGWLISQKGGDYDGNTGIATIQKYAEMFGLGGKSGVEIAESAPHITDQNPIPSCIGQGTHTYATIHLSRYVTTVASSGNLYKYSLISKIQKSDGELVRKYEPEIEQHVDLAQSTWEIIHEGMKEVVGPNGTFAKNFKDSQVLNEVGFAAKSGTAEQSKGRANHATFIAYAPVESPEIALSVAIPNGYGSSYSGALSEQILSYCYGYITLDSILENNHAVSAETEHVSD